jgi:hypothetical protein
VGSFADLILDNRGAALGQVDDVLLPVVGYLKLDLGAALEPISPIGKRKTEGGENGRARGQGKSRDRFIGCRGMAEEVDENISL